MSIEEPEFSRPIQPIGEEAGRSLSQVLGMSENDETLTQLHEELDEIRDNEREAEKAVANIRLR